jgi:glucose-1-phosphate cytidylyltransferase
LGTTSSYFAWGSAHSVKDYFPIQQNHSNDFVLSDVGRTVVPLSSDISDWRITFADTGFETPIGEGCAAFVTTSVTTKYS